MENMVARDGDEELSLFLEMRRREKVQGVSSLPEPETNSVDKTSTKSSVLTTTSCVQVRRSAIEKFLDSENNKSDYEWLLAAPETVGEKKAPENSTVKLKARSNALKPRVENIPQEPVTCGVKASKPISKLKSSTAASKQANTASRTTLPSTKQTNSARNSNGANRTSSNPRPSAIITRSSSVGKSIPGAKYTTPTIPEKPVRPVSTSRDRRGYSSGDRSMGRCKISNDVNPVLLGTQMVERVVNMRKLPPPKQDDKMSSSFGRSLSRSSLNMALRHMNITPSISGNLRVTINAPTNSVEKNKASFS